MPTWSGMSQGSVSYTHLDVYKRQGVYCVGPLMRHLFEKLPPEKRLGWHEDPATLDASQVAALLAPDDVVVIKGSKKIFWVNKFVQKLAAALQASN